MARINVYIPERLYTRAKRARLNVSELTQNAIRDELVRRERMQALDEFTGGLAARLGPASAEEIAAADAWAAEVIAAAERRRRGERKTGRTRSRRSA